MTRGHRDAVTWATHGACVGSGIDFYSYGEDVQLAAVAICDTCPVQEECLNHATRNWEDHGVWGGFTEWERAAIRRRRRFRTRCSSCGARVITVFKARTVHTTRCRRCVTRRVRRAPEWMRAEETTRA